MTDLTDQQLTPAEIRLAQYGERTSTWSTATHNDGTEKALHEIALGLKAEIDRLRQQRRFLLDQIAKKDAASGAGDRAVAEFLAAEEQPAGVEESERCGKCKAPFDPADTRYDGRARYYLTPHCRRCVAACHDNEIADHRCVICA